MIVKLAKFVDKAIWFSFLALVTITPLIFSTRNTEIFEIPKMHFVYFGAILVFFLTLIKFTFEGKVSFPKNWIFFSFLVFVVFQITPTLFSSDKFTSVFGYPSRLNGGLLSQFAYLAIFVAALVNLSKNQAKKLLAAAVIAALAVAIWGIPGHFGHDPSCLVLTGRLTSDCWQKEFDPTLRIFSTLGQPNWLASYLVLVSPFSIYFLFAAKKSRAKNFFLATSIILYTAILMTTSRAGLLGFLIALIIFSLLLLLCAFKTIKQNFPLLGLFVVSLVVITALFGGFLFERIGEVIGRYQLPVASRQRPETTQLPNNLTTQVPAAGGTESSTIRLIVWKGAVEAFKHRPILGFGPETFAYSYYLFRPAEHNQTTEWNFFYNKAHNEFLNYFAGIGAVGTSLYIAFLATILISFYKLIRRSGGESTFLLSAGFASTAGYQTTIFFGFSTVTSQLIFYLSLALALIYANGQNLKSLNLNPPVKTKYIKSSVLVIIAAITLTIPIRFYLADVLLAHAKRTATTNIGQAQKDYESASNIFPFKSPFYIADNAYANSIYATSFEDRNAGQKFAERSGNLSFQALTLSPNNLIVARKVANAFFILADTSNVYGQSALEVGNKLTQLAPTDPQSYYTLAQIQAGLDKKEEAQKTLEEALRLKTDYSEAQELLQQLTLR